MATAIKRTVPVYTTTVALELTDQEALVVHALCGVVGGSKTETNRKHAAAVYTALEAVGVDSYPSSKTVGLDHDSMEFTR